MVDHGMREGPMKDWEKVEAEAGAQEALLRLRGRYRLVVATNAEDSPAADVRLALAPRGPGRVRGRRHLVRGRRRPQAQLRLLPRGAPARGRPRSAAGPAPGGHGRRRHHQRHRRRAAGRHAHHLVQPHQAPVPGRGAAAGRRDPQAHRAARGGGPPRRRHAGEAVPQAAQGRRRRRGGGGGQRRPPGTCAPRRRPRTPRRRPPRPSPPDEPDEPAPDALTGAPAGPPDGR